MEFLKNIMKMRIQWECYYKSADKKYLYSLKEVFINSAYASSYKKEENIVKLDIDDEINTNSFQEKIKGIVITGL